MEAVLQHERVTVTTLTGSLEEKDVTLRNKAAALKEKEDSLSAHQEAARVLQEEAQGLITGK